MNIMLKAATMATLLAALLACQKGMTPEEHIARANQFINEAEYGSAIIELKNALQQNKLSAEARQMLGTAYLASGDAASAEKELRYARKLGWPDNDVVPALARSLSLQGKYSEVEVLETSALEPAAAAPVLALQALAAMAGEDSSKAMLLADSALELDPELPEGLLAKAKILGTDGKLEAADALVASVLNNNPDNAAAWSFKGDLRTAQEQLGEALIAYDKAIALESDDYQTRFKRGLLNLQSGNIESAQADADALLDADPKQPSANYLQGVIHYQAGQYDEAIPSLTAAESAWQQYPLVLYYLAGAHIAQGNVDQGAVLASRFHAAAPGSSGGRKLLAAIELQQGDYAKVQKLLRPVLADSPDDVDALNLMSNAVLRDGKTDEGITLLQQIAKLQPDSPVAQVKLGAGLLLGGETDAAARHMATAIELDPEFQQADMLLVLSHLQSQNYEAAIEAAQAYQRRNPLGTAPPNLLGRVYLAADQPEEAKNLLPVPWPSMQATRLLTTTWHKWR